MTSVDSSHLERLMDDRSSFETRVVRLEENQEHFSNQLDTLTRTVNVKFEEMSKVMSQLSSQIQSRGKVSWPIVLSSVGVFVSCALFTATLVTSYVGLRVTPIEIEAGYVRGMREQNQSLSSRVEVLETENRYRDSILNHLWAETHSDTHQRKSDQIMPVRR